MSKLHHPEFCAGLCGSMVLAFGLAATGNTYTLSAVYVCLCMCMWMCVRVRVMCVRACSI